MSKILASTRIGFAGRSTESPYKISINPSSPLIGDSIQVAIISGLDWVLRSPYDGLSCKRREPPQEHHESINIKAKGRISASMPVAILRSAVMASPGLDADGNVVVTAGHNITNAISITTGAVSIKDLDLVFGTIAIKYRSYGAQVWRHSPCWHSGSYALFATNPELNKPKQITIRVKEQTKDEQSRPSIVTLQAKDFCTDLPIEGATVYLNSVAKGQTDINGKLVVGMLSPGQYSVKIQASGFMPTDSDQLKNDSFTI